MFKKHYKRGISAHFSANKTKMTILNGYKLVQVRALNWSELGVQKKANLDQLIAIKICERLFFQNKNGLKPLFYTVFVTNSV